MTSLRSSEAFREYNLPGRCRELVEFLASIGLEDPGPAFGSRVDGALAHRYSEVLHSTIRQRHAQKRSALAPRFELHVDGGFDSVAKALGVDGNMHSFAARAWRVVGVTVEILDGYGRLEVGARPLSCSTRKPHTRDWKKRWKDPAKG